MRCLGLPSVLVPPVGRAVVVGAPGHQLAARGHGLGPQVVHVVAPAVVVGAAELVVDPLLLHVVRLPLPGVEPEEGGLGEGGSPDAAPARVIPGQSRGLGVRLRVPVLIPEVGVPTSVPLSRQRNVVIHQIMRRDTFNGYRLNLLDSYLQEPCRNSLGKN